MKYYFIKNFNSILFNQKQCLNHLQFQNKICKLSILFAINLIFIQIKFQNKVVTLFQLIRRFY